MNEPSSRLPFLIRRAANPAPCLWAVLVTIGLLVGVSSRAQAQAAAEDADAIAKATQLNKDAIAAFQAHKNDDAKRLLKQALDLCDASGLDQHPVKARTLIHFGIVLISGSKQRELGIKQFRKAIAIQSDIVLTKALVTPELQQAFEEARKSEARADSKPDLKPAPPATEPAADDATEDTTPPAASAGTAPPPEPA